MHVIAHWNPEDKGFWERNGHSVATRNLWLSIPALTLSFAVWMLWSVVVVHLPAASLATSHSVHVRLKYPDTAEVIANAEVAIQLNAVSGAFPGEGINVPQVIDLVAIQFPRPGQVDVQVSIDDEPAGDLSFWLLASVVTA